MGFVRMSTELWAVSPLDGRYRNKLGRLPELVSEGALIRYRVKVEAEWMLHLAAHPVIGENLKLSDQVQNQLKNLSETTGPEACERVKEIEKTTNHDVKAVEYLLREQLSEAGAGDDVLAYIHFACTSEDINNLAYALMLKEARDGSILPHMESIIKKIKRYGSYLCILADVVTNSWSNCITNHIR